jgi:hypothetical protein
MACFRLRTYEQTPPGGYTFDEMGPKPRHFRGEPMIEALAKQVWGYRKGNGLPRATYKEAIEDVDRQTCARLGNSTRFCISCEQNDGQVAMAADTPGLSGPCKGCGAPVTS